MPIRAVSFALICLAGVGQTRRVQTSVDRLPGISSEREKQVVGAHQSTPLIAFAELLIASDPTAAFTHPGAGLLLRSPPAHRSRESRMSDEFDSKAPAEIGGQWPSTGKGYRFIDEDDEWYDACVLADEMNSKTCETPEKFMPISQEGAYPGSYRVQFTLPGSDAPPSTIELLPSRGDDRPSFCAVKMKMPLAAQVDFNLVTPVTWRFVVTDVQNGNARDAGMKTGDIIRAVSLPKSEESEADRAWWKKIGVPQAESGMVMLDGKINNDYATALLENVRVNGQEGEIVLLIERPNPNANKLFRQGRAVRTWGEVLDELKASGYDVE